MTLLEKLEEIATRLAQSPIPDALKDCVLGRLGRFTAVDCDRLLYALRLEEGQLRRLDMAITIFLQEIDEGIGETARAEEAVVAREIACALRDASPPANKETPASHDAGE